MRRGRLNLDTSARMSWRDLGEFFATLKPYFAPPSCRLRTRAYLCFVLLALSKACNVIAPIPLAAAVDQLQTRFAYDLILVFIGLRIGSKVFAEAQRLAYLPVSEAAYTVIADRVFRHVTHLSLQWHTSKRTGAVMRALDRGLTSANTIVSQLFLRLGPTVIELIVLCIIASTAYDALAPAMVLLAGFVVYSILTVRMTVWRRRIRTKMLRQDNTASQIAADALSNAEAVKVFAAEEVEAERYSSAVAAYQLSLNRAQGSLTLLNASQQVVIFLTLGGVLLLAAWDVANGIGTVGRFVLLNTMTVQTFAPLGFLGTIWSMLNTAFADLANLLDLLRQERDVEDKPGAKPLVLAWSGGAARPTGPGKGRKLSGRLGDDDTETTAPIESAHVAAAVAIARSSANGSVYLNTAAAPGRAESSSAAADEPASDSKTASSGTTASATAAPPTIEFDDVWFSYGARAARPGITAQPATTEPGPATAVQRRRPSTTPKQASAPSSSSSEPRMVLKGVSFSVPAGSSLAIVGASGAGKSSIAKLIFRLYDVSSGSVRVGGVDVRDVTVKSLRSQLGMVSQDTTLFNASLGYNIRYGAAGDASVTDEEVAEAARQAALQPLLDRLPNGMDTLVGERGLQLSGGERQRTAIARVLLRRVPIVVADEFSSALDSATEAEVSATLGAAASGRTMVVIAHRLSTAMHCDNIIVLEDGQVVESGTHRELLDAGGRYASMWTLQAKEAVEEANTASSSAAATSDADEEADDSSSATTTAAPAAAASSQSN